MINKINYGFGKDYISNWGVNEALREVFQNYIDYGDYEISVNEYENSNNVLVNISNNYIPNELEFLRLGSTSKKDGDKIGHHGEGLKAAFLIFAREDLYFRVDTNKYTLTSGFTKSIIGETLYIDYEKRFSKDQFVTEFNCPKEIYNSFIKNIISDDDVLYRNDHYGDLLHTNKGNGNIYCGGLFVCKIKGINYSYNIKPDRLILDRDRCTPRDFDLDYATSNILSAYQKSDAYLNSHVIDYNSREYSYSGHVTEAAIEKIESINAKGTIQYLDTNTNSMIVNDRVIETLNNHPKFIKVKEISYRSQLASKIKELKRNRTITLLKLFKKTYCYKHNIDMNIDIDVIINRFKTK